MNLVMSKIINLMKEQKYNAADLELKHQLKKDPLSFALNKTHAVNLLWQEKYNLAIKSFNKCYQINPNDYDVNINLALLFNKVQDYKTSIKFSERALAIDSNKPEVYHNLAESYFYINNLKLAEEHILKSIELRGGIDTMEIFNYKDTLNIYTDILFSKGDEGQFKSVCINLLNKGVFLGDIFRKLFRYDKNAITQNHLKCLYDILSSIDSHKNLIDRNITKANIYSCLAEYNQNIDKKFSEKFYVLSNKLISEVQRYSLYDRQVFAKNAIGFFENPELEKVSRNFPSDLGGGLIFIIGMPRSGTTLTESIISTAENCVVGGEKVFFASQCSSLMQQYVNGDIDFENLFQLGQRYLDTIDIQRRGKKFYVDKLPQNYLYYKFIKKSLPLAKFIHVHRDPWDNAISLFKQYYVKEITYSSSFFGISLEYANYEHLMNKWRSEENNNILDIDYKDLVTNTDVVADKIWNFCDIPGKYNKSERSNHFAQTASKHQVRQEIYTTSLEKEEFVEFKDEFLENLNNQRSYWENS